MAHSAGYVLLIKCLHNVALHTVLVRSAHSWSQNFEPLLSSNFENHTQVFFCQKLLVRSTQMVYHTVSKSSVMKKKLCLPFWGGKNSVKTKKCVEVRGYKICPKK